MKCCAALLCIRSGPQPATVCFNDRTAYGEPHTGALRFSRIKCIEDQVRFFVGKAYARIADRDQHEAHLPSAATG